MAYTRHEPYGVVVSSHSGWLQNNRHGTFANVGCNYALERPSCEPT